MPRRSAARCSRKRKPAGAGLPEPEKARGQQGIPASGADQSDDQRGQAHEGRKNRLPRGGRRSAGRGRILRVGQRLRHLEADLPHIFERGYGTDGGNGLGLTICRDIIESMGGTIAVEKTDKTGTTIRFTVPSGEEEAI